MEDNQMSKQQTGGVPSPAELCRLRQATLKKTLKAEAQKARDEAKRKKIRERMNQTKYEFWLEWSKTELNRIREYLPIQLRNLAKDGERAYGIILWKVENYSKKRLYRLSAADIESLRDEYTALGYETMISAEGNVLILKWDELTVPLHRWEPQHTDESLAEFSAVKWSEWLTR
jgi:hypothetical protein